MAGKKRRSQWSEAFRRQIVAEAEASDKPLSEVARRHGLNPKRLYYWRKQFAPEPEKMITSQEVCLLPVEVKASPKETPVNIPVNTNDSASGFLEIDLPCGSQLRCDSDINPVLLGQALLALKPVNPCTPQ